VSQNTVRIVSGRKSSNFHQLW